MKILALDIGGTRIKYGLFENEELMMRNEIPSKASDGGEALFQTISALVTANRADAVGISTAGQVDAVNGEIIHATDSIPGWAGMELKKRLEKLVDIPVAIENDGNAAALGEVHYGNGKNHKNLVCLVYGTGIGGGLIINGELYRGHTGSAGELGHLVLEVGGRQCMCGARGCYEAYASTSALIAQAKQASQREFDWNTFFTAVEVGSVPDSMVYNEWIGYVSAGIKSLIHTLNPGCVLLGGGIMERQLVTNNIIRKVHDNIMDSFRKVCILPMKLGNNAGLFGAMHSAVMLYKEQKGDFKLRDIV